MRASRGSGSGATLYANSTLALNADTGKLAWYHSYAPGETLDLDEVFERVLVEDQVRNYVSGGGKVAFCGSWTARPENTLVTRKWCSRTSTIPSTRARG